MTRGIITTRHVLLHPITLISCFGLLRYMHMVAMSLNRTPHCFLDYLRL